MKRRNIFFLLITVHMLVISICLISCESQAERQQRINKEQEKKAELVAKQEKELEREKEESLIKERYINNSLQTGATPYDYLYGRNPKCSDWGCSQIKVIAPENFDVLVTIKNLNSVVQHAYISKRSSFIFEMSNGTYQPFFYYGKGWNPNKILKQTAEGVVRGGFIDSETFGKDSPQTLNNAILTYELILQQNGNFSTRPSNAAEAF